MFPGNQPAIPKAKAMTRFADVIMSDFSPADGTTETAPALKSLHCCQISWGEKALVPGQQRQCGN
jgi:hypothetical protein